MQAQTILTKENLLKQADALRDIARRSRRLSETLSTQSDQQRLQRHAVELDESAKRLEKEAIDAKSMVVSKMV
jgi:hypothetical protein